MPRLLGILKKVVLIRMTLCLGFKKTSSTVYLVSRHGVKYKVADIQWRVKEAAFQRGSTNKASNPSDYGGRDTGLDAGYKVFS